MRHLLAVILAFLLAGCSMAPIALDATATAILSGLGAGMIAPRLLNATQPAAPAALPPCADVLRGPCQK